MTRIGDVSRRRIFPALILLLALISCEKFIPTAPDRPDSDLKGIEIRCVWRQSGGPLGSIQPVWCHVEYAVYYSTSAKKFVPKEAVKWSSSNPSVATIDVYPIGVWVRRVSPGEVESCGTFQGVSGGQRLTLTESGCLLAFPGGADGTTCLAQQTLPCGADWPPKLSGPR